MSNRRSRKKFWNSVLQLSFIYLIIIPAVFYILDNPLMLKLVKQDPFLFMLEITGAAISIALIISFWSKRDPELKKW